MAVAGLEWPNQVAQCVARGRSVPSTDTSGSFAENLEQFVLQPGVQDRIWCSGHTFGSDFACGRTEQGQQLGGAAADVLVRLALRAGPRAARSRPGCGMA